MKYTCSTAYHKPLKTSSLSFVVHRSMWPLPQSLKSLKYKFHMKLCVPVPGTVQQNAHKEVSAGTKALGLPEHETISPKKPSLEE